MMAVRSLLILSIALFTLGCEQEPQRSQKERNTLLPLAVGNTWEYQEVQSGDTAQKTVNRSTTQQGATWYRLEDVDGRLYWLRNRGHVQVKATNAYQSLDLPSGIQEEVVFPHPSTAPSSYTTSWGPYKYKPCDRPLSVPAGEFDCHIYTVIGNDGPDAINYYSLGVGLIRTEYWEGDEFLVYELTSYAID